MIIEWHDVKSASREKCAWRKPHRDTGPVTPNGRKAQAKAAQDKKEDHSLEPLAGDEPEDGSWNMIIAVRTRCMLHLNPCRYGPCSSRARARRMRSSTAASISASVARGCVERHFATSPFHRVNDPFRNSILTSD
jgi:hypothetical protein